MTWRNCKASLTLVAEINARWPNRDKASDGTVGDAAHATRASDHNPWLNNTVRARDVDKDGIDAAWCVEHLRKLGAAGDPRLVPGGYLIFNRRITSPDFKTWRAYTGSNPHDKHFHVSFSTNPAGYDSTAPWGIAAAPPPAPEADMSAQFEKDARARWPREDTLERDLRADLAAKQRLLEQLVAGQAELRALVEKLVEARVEG